MNILNDHLAGSWTGTNHDHMAAATNKVSLVVRNDAKKSRLQFLYTYVNEATAVTDQTEETAEFNLTNCTLRRNRKHFEKHLIQLENCDELNRSGYGDYTGHTKVQFDGRSTEERVEYHLTPESWSYEIYVLRNPGVWVRTGDWTFNREPAKPAGPQNNNP